MESQPTPFEALQIAVKTAGSQSALARICGVSQTAVWKWLQSGKRLPAEHVLPVEAETKVSRFDLRPDIYPPEPSDSRDVQNDEFCGVISTFSNHVVCDPQTISQPSNDA